MFSHSLSKSVRVHVLVKRPVVLLWQFNAMVAAWLAVFLNFHFYHNINSLVSHMGMSAHVFILSMAGIIFCIYLFIFQLLSWPRLAKALALILIVIGGLSSYFVSELGIDIDKSQIVNLMQTDTREVLDLLSWNLMQWCVLTIVFPASLVIYLKIKPQPIKKIILHKLVIIPNLLLFLSILIYSHYAQLAPIFRENRNLKAEISPFNSLSSLHGYFKTQFKAKNSVLIGFGLDAHMALANSQQLPRLMVLVVGETARAESFSLNGYNKITNPELSQLDILNFTQAVSCGTATAVSVPCMFSGMPRQDYDAGLAEHREGLLDIAQRAGYEVTWIDNNSGCKRTCDRVNTLTIPDELKTKWCEHDECLDGILVDSLQLYLQQLQAKPIVKNQLIVLHQMGSHGPAYYKRYPKIFKKFKPTCNTNNIQTCNRESLINTYDNSIVYTDHILAQLIDTLKQENTYQTGLWYVSDHGESTGEHGLYLHGAPYMIAPSQQTHVPMLMWFSTIWQQQQAQAMACLKSQLSLPRGQDNLFPTLLSLLEIKSQVINPKLDMLATCNTQAAS